LNHGEIRQFGQDLKKIKELARPAVSEKKIAAWRSQGEICENRGRVRRAQKLLLHARAPRAAQRCSSLTVKGDEEHASEVRLDIFTRRRSSELGVWPADESSANCRVVRARRGRARWSSAVEGPRKKHRAAREARAERGCPNSAC